MLPYRPFQLPQNSAFKLVVVGNAGVVSIHVCDPFAPINLTKQNHSYFSGQLGWREWGWWGELMFGFLWFIINAFLCNLIWWKWATKHYGASVWYSLSYSDTKSVDLIWLSWWEHWWYFSILFWSLTEKSSGWRPYWTKWTPYCSWLLIS